MVIELPLPVSLGLTDDNVVSDAGCGVSELVVSVDGVSVSDGRGVQAPVIFGILLVRSPRSSHADLSQQKWWACVRTQETADKSRCERLKRQLEECGQRLSQRWFQLYMKDAH